MSHLASYVVTETAEITVVEGCIRYLNTDLKTSLTLNGYMLDRLIKY